jgi:hypothetical protein
MPVTYELISSTTLATATSSITISSIPQTYTDLVSVWYMPSTASGGQDPYVEVNGQTGSYYGAQSLDAQSTMSAARSLNMNSAALIGFQYGYTESNQPLLITSNFANYTNTTYNKTIISDVASSYSTSNPRAINVCVYRDTLAITSLKFNIATSTNNMAVGTVLSLYGIKAA